MNSEPRFWLRFSIAVLLAPLAAYLLRVMALLLFILVEGFWPRGDFSVAAAATLWMWTSLGVAVAALFLRWVGKTRLRHHMTLALLIGAVPVVKTLVDFARIASMKPGESAMEIPSCVELFRFETFNLVGEVSAALALCVTGACFKWLAYGFDRQQVSWGWKISGFIFMLALAVDMLTPIGELTGVFPSWYSLRELCA